MSQQQLDYEALADIFPDPTSKKRRAKREYTFNGRKAIVGKYGREWEGYFNDDHSVTFIADTKRQLLFEMESEA